jgi:hypothetical protein
MYECHYFEFEILLSYILFKKPKSVKRRNNIETSSILFPTDARGRAEKKRGDAVPSITPMDFFYSLFITIFPSLSFSLPSVVHLALLTINTAHTYTPTYREGKGGVGRVEVGERGGGKEGTRDCQRIDRNCRKKIRIKRGKENELFSLTTKIVHQKLIEPAKAGCLSIFIHE